MKTIQLFAFVLFFSMNLVAQSSNYQEINHIEVTGIAKEEIVPDEVYIELTLNERIEKGKKVSIEQLENQLKKELTTINVPLENLSISNLNSQITKISWWREKVLASAEYELKINDATKLKEVFNVFELLKIKDAEITRATHSKLQELKKKNRINAIKSAKEKASYLLKAIGQRVGKPIKIVENENHHLPDFAVANYSGGNSYMRKKVSLSNTDIKRGNIQFKKIKLQSSIYIKFRIL